MLLKLLGISSCCFVLICGMTGVASAQSVPFYPPEHGTFSIPGTYDFVSAGGRPEYNLHTKQLPGTAPVTTKAAPVATKTAQLLTGAQMQHPAGS
jgi:hypothetical protein